METLRKLLLIIVVFGIGFTATVYLLSGKFQKSRTSFAAVVPTISPIVTPNPSNITKITSPDGKMILTVKEKKTDSGNIWTLSIEGKDILSKNLPVGTTLSVPFNTFSPDNKYIFLKENSSGGDSYLVLSTGGVSLTKEGQILEFVSLFAQKHSEYKITEATGWGGMNLIVFNTEKTNGGAGPSFWFEVPTHSFIQLSSKFN